MVRIKDGKALVGDKAGKRAEVGINDYIGKGKNRIVEIEKAYIIVETEGGRTRRPIIYGFDGR